MKKIISMMLVLIVVLTACSSSEENTSSNETLSYETENGIIEYPSNPTIYADYYVGELLYLDADVIGADMTWPADTWTDIAKERGVENISGDMENIALLEPELIITISADYYDQYSAIAPTIYIPYGTYDPEEIMLEMGKILDKEDEALAWQEEFNQGIAEITEMIDHPEYTYGIADAWDSNVYMYGQNYGRGGYIIYDKLGLSGTAAAEEDYIRSPESYISLDGETLTQYAGDVFIVMDNGEGNTDAITSLPTYDTLEAVENDRVFMVDDNIYLYNDPYSLNAQIEDLKEIFSSEDL